MRPLTPHTRTRRSQPFSLHPFTYYLLLREQTLYIKTHPSALPLLGLNPKLQQSCAKCANHGGSVCVCVCGCETEKPLSMGNMHLTYKCTNFEGIWVDDCLIIFLLVSNIHIQHLKKEIESRITSIQ